MAFGAKRSCAPSCYSPMTVLCVIAEHFLKRAGGRCCWVETRRRYLAPSV